MIEQVLQKARSFWAWWRGLSCFGQKLPLILASILFIGLVFYIFSEISRIECGAVGIKQDAYLIPIECERGPFSLKKVIETIGSDTVRNLNLLLAASIGWFFLYWRAKTADLNAEASEQSAEATRKNAEIAEKGLTAERFTRAIEQLAHEKPSVRLGGILGLEQVALAQKEEHEKIIRILVSFIRTRARKKSKEVGRDLDESGLSKLKDIKDIDDFKVYRERRLDVEDAIRVLANIASKIEKAGQFQEQYNKSKSHFCNLQGTDLRGLELVGLDLSNFNLEAVDFSGAFLWRTNFNKATLSSRFMIEKRMPKFVGTYLFYSTFNDTNLSGVDFSDSYLSDAIFNNASLGQTVFKNCHIDNVHFETSHDLTQEQIDKAYYYTDEHPPILSEGLKPPSPRNR